MTETDYLNVSNQARYRAALATLGQVVIFDHDPLMKKYKMAARALSDLVDAGFDRLPVIREEAATGLKFHSVCQYVVRIDGYCPKCRRTPCGKELERV